MRLVRELNTVNATFQHPITKASTTPSFWATFCLTTNLSVSRAAFWRSLNLELFRSPPGSLGLFFFYLGLLFLDLLVLQETRDTTPEVLRIDVQYRFFHMFCNHVTVHSWKLKRTPAAELFHKGLPALQLTPCLAVAAKNSQREDVKMEKWDNKNTIKYSKESINCGYEYHRFLFGVFDIMIYRSIIY